MLVKVETVDHGTVITVPAILKIREIQIHEQDYQKVIGHTLWKHDGGIFISEHHGSFQQLTSNGYKPVELIAYSEIEDVLPGDHWYNRETNQIVKCEGEIIPDNFNELKILAFHHNFTKEHIQQAIDGKLKDGDELDIVCTDSVVGVPTQDDYYISLDMKGKIELHDKPVEETKSFSDLEVAGLFRIFEREYREKEIYKLEDSDRVEFLGNFLLKHT